GVTWTNVADTSFMFVGATNFPDWAHFYTNNRGIALGDPNGGNFEIYHTYNGGTTWTRVPNANIPAPSSTEYGLTDSYFTYGKKYVWFGTSHSANAVPHVYRSNDTGHTWQSATVAGLLGGVSGLAFRDSLNGLCWGYSSLTSGKFMIKRTTDGGNTWTSVFQRGKVGEYDMCVIPGRNAYMSVGIDSTSAAGTGGIVGNGILTSVTYDDGDTWNILESGPGGPTANKILMLKVQMVDSAHGWAGSFSDTTNKPLGGGGMNTWKGPKIPFSCPLNISGATAICSGNSTVLTASGATSYTWSPASVNTATISVSPSTTAIYTVSSLLSGCANTKTYTLTVTTTPTVAVASSVTNDTICSGSSTTLSASGTATSYSWAPAGSITGTGATVVAHPTVTTTFTLTGHTGTCTGTTTLTITVNACVGINQFAVNGAQISFYPNPSNGAVSVSLTNAKVGTVLMVSDMLGNEVYKTSLNSNSMTQTLNIDLTALPKGVYLFGVSSGNQSKVQKLVIQ
ncbi:MAG TPA: T9SS type A sorting domain-containing protein, partial [Bacteroidia bacterium]|nr:T9SS type A sorting domain-containing protein [Bacteroidia bacterium]